MKLAIIFDRFNEATLGVYYEKAFKKMGIKVTHFWLKDSFHIEPSFDAYLRVDDGDYKTDIPHDILKPSFFYVSDVHLKKPFKAISKAAKDYDYLFCAQKSGFEKLKDFCKEDKILWLPHAFDPDLHRDLGIERKLDIAFVGNDGGIPRKFILQELRERYSNSYIDTAPNTDIAKIYSSAKIGFNYSIADDINMRFFEVMGCGAMLLTNHIGDNGFGGLFTDKHDLAVYDSPKEIFEMIDYYLKNDMERETIAASGKRLASSGHTYDARAYSMLNEMRRFIKVGAGGLSL